MHKVFYHGTVNQEKTFYKGWWGFHEGGKDGEFEIGHEGTSL